MQYLLTEEEYLALKNKPTEQTVTELRAQLKRAVKLIFKIKDWECIYEAAKKEDGYDPQNPEYFDFDYACLYCDGCPLADFKNRIECGKQRHFSK